LIFQDGRRLLGGRLCLLVFSACTLAYCGNNSSPLSPSSANPGASTLGAGAPVLVGAGDIGLCGSGSDGAKTAGAELTARLLDRVTGTVFTAGDNAYMTGSLDEYRNCYEPTWGRHRARTRPVPGNHEYNSGGGPYFEYFGAAAGPAGAGYYSYNVGSWRVIALNSEIPSQNGTPQMEWLRAELNARRATCTAVIWHRPLFSSGRNGDSADMRDVWRTLYDANVDVVINGHDHSYERFAPQDPDGKADPVRGIRQFTVGTGGAMLYEFTHVRPNSEARGAAWGVAMFTLNDGGYSWQFIPVDGASFSDAGSGTCH
jgi:acid phosphatase type 7